jgi:hypothetical protein
VPACRRIADAKTLRLQAIPTALTTLTGHVASTLELQSRKKISLLTGSPIYFKTHALRKRRHPEIGHTYHVILSINNKQSIFIDLDIARKIVLVLLESDHKNLNQTRVYLVMHDHIHWLFELKVESLSKYVQRVNLQVSREIGNKI